MIAQGTADWRIARAGKLTASNFHRVMAAKTPRALLTLAREIADEAASIAAGVIPDTGSDVPAMKWGRENEAEARARFVLETGIDVAEAPFVAWAGHPLIGASPDGLTADGGVLEIKCPFSREQHHTYGNGPGRAVYQIQGQMLVTQRRFAWFVSFDPRERPELQLYYYRVEADAQGQLLMLDRIIPFVEQYLKAALDFAGVEVAA